MLAALTGIGLSSAAGLNAYIPLLLVGLVARYTDLLPLGSGWQWLEHPVTLVSLGVLLIVEFAVDKIPGADSVNDVVQTIIRPASGGITFGAGAASFDLDEVAAMDDGSLWPIVSGVVIALAFHAVKSLARPVINAASLGIGGFVSSVVEDVSSFTLALLAILIPIVILLLIPLFAVFVIWLIRQRRRRKAAKNALQEN